MPLESATYINQLNSANPAPTDLIGQGDDHIRLVKAVLQATFPNIAGPVNATEAQLNGLSSLIPIGLIAAWYGSSASVPAGWHICDGSTVVRSDGGGNITLPNLQNLVIMGPGSVAAQGTTYGLANQTANTNLAGSHAHSISGDGTHGHPTATVNGHALAVSEMPAHQHLNGVGDDFTNRIFTRGSGAAATNTGYNVQDNNSFPSTYEGLTESVGAGAAHTHGLTFPTTDGAHDHTVSTDAGHVHSVTLPVYQPAMALYYIMKV